MILLLLLAVIQNVQSYRNLVAHLNSRSSFLSMSTERFSPVKLTPLVTEMKLSKTIEIHGKTKELESKGIEVFSLCVGEPDYEPPQIVIEATAKAAREGHTKYTSVNGDVRLRRAIQRDLQSRKGLAYTADNIVISNGAKQSVIQALMAIVDSGDKVLIPAPYWTSYPDMVKMCRGEPIDVPTRPEDNYVLTADALRKSLEDHGDRVKAIILCNPSNPTGSVASREQQLALVEVLLEYPQVTVISDEIYERLVYDNIEHVSFASLHPAISHRTITINGFSKSHAMTGYRLGYSVSNLELAKAMSKIQSQLTSCASSIAQEAAVHALAEENHHDLDRWLQARVTELQEKRDLALRLIREIPHVRCPTPQGAFYLLPDISHYYGKYHQTADGERVQVNTSHELCMQLLSSEGVALVGGDAFGAEDTVRISYATSKQVIEESLTRLRRFLLNLK